MDKKGSAFAPNDRPRSYNVLNEKGNLRIRNRRHLFPTNEKFIVKHDYNNIMEPHEATSRKTVVQARTEVPSSITTPPVRTKFRSIIRKPRGYLEEC